MKLPTQKNGKYWGEGGGGVCVYTAKLQKSM